MIKRIFALALIAGFAWIFYLSVSGWQPKTELNGVASEYVKRGADELGAMNLVTAIVVTYRGLDPLGEVTVLLLASTGVALLLGYALERWRVPERADQQQCLGGRRPHHPGLGSRRVAD